jgi:hypothetical protein
MKLAEQVKTTLRSRLSTFQTIAEQIAQKALEQVPQIRSITIETDLASVAQSLPVSASVWYGGKTYPIGLDFDLMNPAKAAAEIANGFSEAYPPASLASARRGKNAKRKGTKKTRGATRKK